MKPVKPIIVLCMLLAAAAGAMAEPGRGKADQSKEPKRPYGAVDVILYQVSW